MTAMRDRRPGPDRGADPDPRDVQDALITVLSEKTLPVPELGRRGPGAQGLQRDRHRQRPRQGRQRAVVGAAPPVQHRGAAAAGRRARTRSAIVTSRVAELAAALELPEVPTAEEEIRRVVTVFRELRSGVTADGRTTVKSPSGTLSAAEAISVITSGLALSAHFGDGTAGGRRRGGRPGRRGGQGPGQPTRSPGPSTWRSSSATAPAGPSSTAPAARCPERRPTVAVRARGCRRGRGRRCSASGTTAPARPGRWWPR